MASSSKSADKNGPVYFWREYDHPYGFLSQWYDCAFEVDGSTYRTAEEWMMVGKARLFGDEKIAEAMLQAATPKEHKALGRKVKGFDEDVWNKNKFNIVVEGTFHKFTKSKEASDLAEKLLETGDRELVEASPFDKIWGIGFSENKAEKNRYKWGKNLLGEALMKVRKSLQEEQAQRQGIIEN